MSSRGSVAKNGHVTTDNYNTVSYVLDAKVLSGNGNNHSLPDYSHSKNTAYIKLKPDGTLHEIRFYGDNNTPIIEIAFHPEPQLNNGDKKYSVLHYHTFNGLDRSKAQAMTKSIKEKYKDYLKEFGLYD